MLACIAFEVSAKPFHGAAGMVDLPAAAKAARSNHVGPAMIADAKIGR